MAKRVEATAEAELHDDAGVVLAGVEVGEHGGQERVASQRRMRFSVVAWPSLPFLEIARQSSNSMAYSHEDSETSCSPSRRPDADAADEGEVPRAEQRSIGADGCPSKVRHVVREWRGGGR